MGIKVIDVAFVRFRAPDLDEMESFLDDFGMHRSERSDDTLYMRGADDEGFVHVTQRAPEAGFVGVAFEAASEADLAVLAERDEFSAIEPLDGPGGGSVVRTTDPDGFQVEVVAGRDSVGSVELGRQVTHNDGNAQPRLNEATRLDAGPSQVKRLGHCVLDVQDFRTSEAWYKERFGLVTSDEIALDENSSLGAFLRCDRGSSFVDHHTLFLVGAGRSSFNHAAFEVVNFDDLMLGNTHLKHAGREHAWGIGRHVLGSQIYDYWRDPFGHMVEHWTDGDLFNSEDPPAIQTVQTLMASQWGPTNVAPGRG